MEVTSEDDWKGKNYFYGLWSYYRESDYSDLKKCMHSLCQSDQKENLNEMIRLLIENGGVVSPDTLTLTYIAYEKTKQKQREVLQRIERRNTWASTQKNWIQSMTEGYRF
jgi:hypothetical protein